jgi:hypothetical protein
MIELNPHSIVLFASLVIYIILVSFVMYSRQVRLKRLFAIFLAAGVGISVSSLLMNLRFSYEYMMLWKLLLPLFITWSVVAYAHFIFGYTGESTTRIIKWGYFWLYINFVLVGFGYLTQGLNILNNDIITACYGYVFNSLVFVNDLFLLLLVFYIIGFLKKSTEPEERNRTTYLLVGLCIMVVTGIFKYIMQDLYYIFAGVGCTVNAVIITYTLLRYRLLDIQVIMRKWVVYTGVTVCVTLAYLALLLGLSNLLRLLPPHFGIPATIVMVVFFGYLFNWVKSTLDKAADKLFYGNRYIHRQMLLNFASKTGNLINIREIANALITPLVKTVRANQVGLLLPANNHYT